MDERGGQLPLFLLQTQLPNSHPSELDTVEFADNHRRSCRDSGLRQEEGSKGRKDRALVSLAIPLSSLWCFLTPHPSRELYSRDREQR
jgi:hypothetical protein